MTPKDTFTTELPLVSIVVPVYNVEPYLERCLDSILEQTYPYLDIIVVDDGSTDNSGKICDRYAQADSRITVFHIDNKGLSGARNFGLQYISGGYIAFIDSDDFVGTKYVENLLSAALAINADMAITGSKHVPATSPRPKDQINPSEFEIMTPVEAINAALRPGIKRNFYITAWGKLYKSSLGPVLHFPEGRNFEDIFIMHQVFNSCNKLIYENANDYYYCFNREGSISKQHDESYLDIIEANRRPFDYALKHLPETVDSTAKRYYANVVKTYADLVLEGNDLRDKVFQLIVNERKEVLFSKHPLSSTKAAYTFSLFGQRVFDKIITFYTKINNSKG